MSPLALRRYRADRLLRGEFEGLRASVVGSVRSRLARSGVVLDDSDLDACYAQAWQGLYTAVLAGEEIASPGGWLVTVCFRRAIDEHRSRSVPGRRLSPEDDVSAGAVGSDGDFAAALDDRDRLRRLLEGIGASMSQREREAASLCFLQGLSRAEAAREMGIAPRRLERLMDGRGGRRPGVAAKLGALTETIAAGRFCEERASAMRALAFGVLDPEGERHRLAMAHQRTCPACRAYVLRLRGLAAALPPILLPGLFAAARSTGRAAANRGHGRAMRLRQSVLRRSPLAGKGAGVGSAVSAKLAVVGLLAVGAGAGALALSTHSRHDARPTVATTRRGTANIASQVASGVEDRSREVVVDRSASKSAAGTRPARARALGRSHSFAAGPLLTDLAPSLAWREFGFERRARSASHARSARARGRTAASAPRARTIPPFEDAAATPTTATAEAEEPREDSSADPSSARALREFGIE